MRYAEWLLEEVKEDYKKSTAEHWYAQVSESFDKIAVETLKEQTVQRIKHPSSPLPKIETLALEHCWQSYLIYYIKKAKKDFDENPEEALDWFTAEFPLFLERLPDPERDLSAALGNPLIDKYELCNQIARKASEKIIIQNHIIVEMRRKWAELEKNFEEDLISNWIAPFIYRLTNSKIKDSLYSGVPIRDFSSIVNQVNAKTWTKMIAVLLLGDERKGAGDLLLSEAPSPAQSVAKMRSLFDPDLHAKSLAAAQDIGKDEFLRAIEYASAEYTKKDNDTPFSKILYQERLYTENTTRRKS